MSDPLENLIGPLLLSANLKLVVAESCTGGLVGHRITNVPGSSEYYLGSVTAYAYDAKRRLLGVNPQTLLQFGAVSRETVLEMAAGIRRAFSGDEFEYDQIIGMSVSGIAGPGGGMPGKPVGLVWIGLSAKGLNAAWRYVWPGDRLENKALSAQQTLQLLWDFLNDQLPPEDR